MEIVADTGLVEHLLDVFHGVGAEIGRQGTGLTHRVYVPHVPDWRKHDIVLPSDLVIHLFIGRHCLGHEPVLEFVGVVGSCETTEFARRLPG